MIAETEEVDISKMPNQKFMKIKSAKKSSIKSLQKQAVNFQNYGKVNALQQVEAKLEALEKEIDEIPIVQEFKESQFEVNELLQIVSNTIANKVTDEIIVSTEGTFPRKNRCTSKKRTKNHYK